jgi:4a-hydroxytetrahydrobiopterin dehydratase
MARLLKADEIVRQLSDLPDWQWDGDTLHRDVAAPTFVSAIGIVTEIADVAEEMDHHPDIDIRFNRLGFALSTHTAKGVTQLDIELAHRSEEIAGEHDAV